MFPFQHILIGLLVFLLVYGLIEFIIRQFPIDAMIVRLVRIAVVVLFVLWLISVLLGAPVRFG